MKKMISRRNFLAAAGKFFHEMLGQRVELAF